MAAINIAWLASTALLSIIAWLRFRSRLQPIGSLVVACAMFAAAAAIICGAEDVAKILQAFGIAVAVATIVMNERWKRTQQ